MTMIDARPAEVADRSVPGHWEGDLITGAYNRSAIGTLVERSSRFTILLHLPDGRHTADLVRDALVEAFTQLPAAVRRSLGSSSRCNTQRSQGVAMDEKSTRQGRPGPEPLSAERELYRQLMAQGMGNSQACREIGINRRTGTRWRYGRIVDTRDGRAAHHYPPITRPRPAVISARYLSAKERNTIADLRRAGRTMTAIAAELGRSAGTISRELGQQ